MANKLYNRKSIRLSGYDYASPGIYFVTICTQNRECLLGDVVNNKMVLNDAGKMVYNSWNNLRMYSNNIDIDVFEIMPNHIHGIIIIMAPVGADHRVCPKIVDGTKQGRTRWSAPTVVLSDIVRRFKTFTTKKYIDGIKTYNWQPFNKRLWQRNYFEHIIRNDHDLEIIRKYIINNPIDWQSDYDNI